MEQPETGPGDVERFWDLAKVHARLNPAPSYFGPTALESVTPPAFQLGEAPHEADSAVAALVQDREMVLDTPLSAYGEGEELPGVGALAIVLDGEGHPRVLVETTEVSVSADTVTERLRVVYDA